MTMQPNPDFLKKILATFLVEAREHVQALGAGLLELEQAASRDTQRPLVETLFREAHSLKGAARAVNAREIERLCQALEGVFGDVKSGKRDPSPDAIDGLHRAVAVLGQLIDATDAGKLLPAVEIAAVLRRLVPEPPTDAAAGRGATVPPSPGSPLPPPAGASMPAATEPVARAVSNDPDAVAATDAHTQSSATDSVRVAATKLDAIFIQAEELLGMKLVHAERVLEIRALAGRVAERDRLWGETLPLIQVLRRQIEIRADAPAGGAEAGPAPRESLARLLALLDQDREHTEAIGAGVADLTGAMTGDRRRFDVLADRLLEDVKRALMLPLSSLLAGFPKMARDLAREAGKEVFFDLHGADIEIDKRIIGKMKDPLLHLVRNSVDHGIELPAERARHGKPPRGTVTLAITQAGGKVEIQVADDGAGVDVTAVKAAAVRAGVIGADEAAALDDHDARQLVFKSGVTTSRQVTTVSGRGLGMAIVHENVVNLGGTVAIESTVGAGTTVRMLLPLTLATLQGVVVRAANREFVIPTIKVARVVQIAREAVRRVENRDSLCLDETTLSLVRLADVLGLPRVQTGGGGATAALTVLVLEHGQARMAFAVDEVVGKQEVLAKPLGTLLPRVRNLAGATVFGTGRVVPILNVPDLLRTAAGYAGGTERETEAVTEAGAVRAKRLLVVDDSITARTLLQSILESTGYDVKTAPDGAAALKMLRAEPFGLVVSDIEMPKMNGFELTRRIRGEPKLAELPVVLVTALEAKEDRERGIDAGANAYIAKSSFDQSNLLDVVGRLI